MPTGDAASPSATSEKAPAPGEVPLMQISMRNTQLPSPASPNSQPSPFGSPAISLSATSSSSSSGCIRADHLLPIRGFVHEVLRRSRTSTGVLQTALCYLEAVRSKVPCVLAQERLKQAHPELHQESGPERIILGDSPGEACEHSDACPRNNSMDGASVNGHIDPCIQGLLTAPSTEIIADSDIDFNQPPLVLSAATKTPSTPLPPLPPSPSPLLCPRRTFLACLILASKFMQDRSYSNKAWAKLAGLPPREIGRCERAVGEALEWRLWVGKGPSTPSGSSATVHRAVARCKTELVIRTPTCAWPTPTTPASLYTTHAATLRAGGRGHSNLRRSATMPDLEACGNTARDYPTTRPEIRLFEPTMQISMETTLVAEPDMDDFAVSGQYPPLAAWAAPSVQASLHAGELSSPAASTPGLAYSPMSTSSTVSSDDGERTVNMPFRYTPSQFGSSFELELNSGKSTIPTDHSPWAANAPIFSGDKLAPIEPAIVDGPVRLPPLSEAVSNPILIERTLAPCPNFSGTYGIGSNSNSYSSSYNWSVSGMH